MASKARTKTPRDGKPQASPQAAAPAGGGTTGGVKLVVGFVAAGLVAMFLWSFAYRVDNPSLVQAPRQPQAQADDHDHEQQGDEAGMKMIATLMQRLQENPNDVDTLAILGEQFMRMQQWERASQLLERALAAAPGNIDVLSMLGICDFNREKYRESADKFETILELAPQNMMARYNLGILYGHFLKDAAKAREFLQAVADAPDVDEQTRQQARDEIANLK